MDRNERNMRGVGGIKVALVHNIMSPYRLEFFEALSKVPGLDLRVFFCSGTHKERLWEIRTEIDFHGEILPGLVVDLRKTAFHFNPSLITILKEEKFDVIIIGGISDATMQIACLMARLQEKPMILWSEETGFAQPLAGMVSNPLRRWFLRTSSAVIVPGTAAREFVTQLGATPERVFVAPNAINNMALRSVSSALRRNRTEWKERLGLRSDKVILYVGQLIQRKGLECLLNAYAAVRDHHHDAGLVIVGEGESRRSLERLCADRSIEDVTFTGWVAEDQKLVYYAISDVFVLPTFRDVWGFVVNEAMACGLPVVCTTATGSARDLIFPAVNGFMVEAGHVGQLARAIESVIGDDNLAARMGRNSFDIINRVATIEKMVDGFAAAIRSTVGCRQ